MSLQNPGLYSLFSEGICWVWASHTFLEPTFSKCMMLMEMCWRAAPVLGWPFWVSACQCEPWLFRAPAELEVPLPSVGPGLLQVDFLSGAPPFLECQNPWIHSALKHWSSDQLDLCCCGLGDRPGLWSEVLLIGESSNRKQLWREEILLEYRAGYGRTDLKVVFVWICSRPLITAVYISVFGVVKLCVLTWAKNM